MRVSVYHNVARDEAGRMINFDGYKSGHPIVHVFDAYVDVGDEVFASALTEMVWTACNLGPDELTGRMAVLARAYRDRRLRSLSVGDVVALGEGEDGDDRLAMCVDAVGFSFVRTDRLNIVTTCDRGTQPWPPDTCPVHI